MAAFSDSPSPNNVAKGAYANGAFHFSVSYPLNLAVREYQEEGGAITVTFQDIPTDQKFQVYVTPYRSKEITQERFRLDEPSRIRQDPIDVTIDGTKATAFYSHNDILDDTREIWFIHGGYLYEVTSYKELSTWLDKIMQSWKLL